jgi:hypothetical protein
LEEEGITMTAAKTKRLERRLVLTGLILGATAVAPSIASANDVELAVCGEEGFITTDGQGEVRVPPDSFRVDVGVQARAATLDQARTEVNTKMQEVIRALEALHIPDMTLQTQILQFNPIYADRTADEPLRVVAYEATNQVTATVLGSRPAVLGEKASRIVDAALDAGGNLVGGIDFFLEDPSRARADALTAAMEDAKRDAMTLAEAAGVTLGALQSVDETPGSRVVPFSFNAVALRQAGPSTPVETGEIVVSSTVTARFRFTP